MSTKSVNTSRMILPNLSTPQLSYTQRYQHMTKLANYSEMNQGQIWKQYEKLRSCLKQINQEVLYHMQKKAYVNINNKQKEKKTNNKDNQGTLMVLEDEKKTNQLRYSNFYTELVRLEERINYLSGKKNYLEQMTIEIQELEDKIKMIKKDNKDYKRKTKIIGKNIVNCTSALDKLILEEDRLNRANIRHRRLKDYLQNLQSKEQRYKQRIKQTDQAIDNRLKQFSSQENFIQQEIHYDRYEELKRQKEGLMKYQQVYKRNYLMKLKDLENFINSIAKHEKVIQENQGNILNVRGEIETITQLVGKSNVIVAGQKRRSSSSAMNMSMNVRIKSKQNQQSRDNNNTSMSIQMKQPNLLTARKRIISHMNDKNDQGNNRVKQFYQ